MTNQCKICANSLGNQEFVVREMLLGTRENFNYFRCSSCGCLQITEIPEDLSRFYPNENYYSFQQGEHRTFGKKLKSLFYKCAFNRCGDFLLRKRLWLRLLNRENAIKKTSSILDVGCGVGNLLQEMSTWGFKNLTGIDPFLEKDILYSSGVKVLKQNVFNHAGGPYDLITLHHSFEHMENPHLVFKRLNEMLKPNGFLVMRIPVSDGFAWRKYGTNWSAIQAPLHFFLYTTKSMTILSKKAGFVLKHIAHESTEVQFLESEKYRRDISSSEHLDFSSKYVRAYKKQARRLNRIMDGDMACFLFFKEGRNGEWSQLKNCK